MFDWFHKLSPNAKYALCAAAVTLPGWAWQIHAKRAPRSFEFETFLRDPEATASDAKDSSSFDDFLKAPAQKTTNTFDSCVFESFLRNGGASAQTAPAKKEQVTAPPAAPRAKPGDVRVLVMYGTEYGFSKEIAGVLCKRLQDSDKYWPVLVDMADHPKGYPLAEEQAVLVICSTQGDGVPPTEPREFCEWLFAGNCGKLEGVHYSVCALGDKTYNHYCRCGKLIDAAFEKQGAKQLADRKDIDREDWPNINKWMDSVLVALATHQFKPIGEGAAAPDVPTAAPSPMAKTGNRRWTKSKPFNARVVAVEKLCKVEHADDKNTVRVEFDLGSSGLAYIPGDALGIYPKNRMKDVDELINLLGADPMDLVPLPAWHYEEQDTHYPNGVLPLEMALSKCYDLRQPKLAIFQLLLSCCRAVSKANGATNGNVVDAVVKGNGSATNGHGVEGGESAEIELLQRLVSGSAKDQEAFCEGRHVADILRTFPAARLTTSQLLPVLKPLLHRLYSISSSPLEHSKRVQATIAEVKYSAHKRDRVGVCSTYTSERIKVGSHVPIFMHTNPDFRLPTDMTTPIIMVGPGTGLAPFRSFIAERLLRSSQQAAGPPPGHMLLFFGCRHRDQDYLYRSQLEEWAAGGHVTLVTAFSREQGQKVYVQNRMAEHGDLVWDLLQKGGHFYICGDALNMAGQVQDALLQIIASRQPGGVEAAQKLLEQLEASKRFQRDVWY